jgi:predicted ATP-grasp superfamily ATP-dependent carboligase
VVARKDPKALYELAPGTPGLAGVVLLHQMEGFMDAGGAGRLASEHLLDQFDHRLVASFDVDRLIDYRSRRPTMTFDKDHYDHYEDPALDLHLLTDGAGKRFLLLDGLEPDREWELFARAVQSLIEQFDVRVTVGMHGIPMGIPHTRPLGVTAHATRPELVDTSDQPPLDRLQVPGSASALLEYRLGEAGLDAMGFAVHVPHYLASSLYPTAAIRLLKSISAATGLDLPAGELEDAARRAAEDIERQVRDSPEIADVVRALERQYDMFADTAGRENLLSETAGRLPTAEELGAEFERFLADHDADPPGKD